jgi:hypothetical protein
VDCGGIDRLLYSNDSLGLSGVTISGGQATVTFDVDFDAPLTIFQPGGGGAVWVQWAPAASGLVATFRDLRLENNSLSGRVTGTGAATVVVGGAGVFVSGGANNSLVVFQSIVAVGNRVRVAGGVPRGFLAPVGAGLAVSMGCGAVCGTGLSRVTVVVEDTVVQGNIADAVTAADVTYGGGLYVMLSGGVVADCNVYMTRVVIADNVATGWLVGGGSGGGGVVAGCTRG